MRDAQPDLPVHEVGSDDVRGSDLAVHDVSSSGVPVPASDTVRFGSPRVGRLLVLGAALVATVAAIALIANHAADHGIAAPSRPPVMSSAPSPTPPAVVSARPVAPGSALAAGRVTCFIPGPRRGGTIMFEIHNHLSRSLLVQSVSLAPQHGVVVAATSIGVNSPTTSDCPKPQELHSTAHYVVEPGWVWIAARLTRTPACRIDLHPSWLVSFTDGGKLHHVRFAGVDLPQLCPLRPHLSHGRHG